MNGIFYNWKKKKRKKKMLKTESCIIFYKCCKKFEIIWNGILVKLWDYENDINFFWNT